MRTRSVLATALALLLILAPVASAQAAPVPGQDSNWDHSDSNPLYPPGCMNVLFVGVRGSGEQGGENYGRMVEAVRDGLRETMPSGFTVRQVALNYPARDTSVLGQDIVNLQSTYFDGMLAGAQELRRLMDFSARRCPEQQIVLAGYSQGAGVIHRVLSDFPTPGVVRSAVLIADPGRRSGQSAATTYGSPQRAGGILQVAGLLMDPIAATYRSKVIEYCTTSDPICDLGLINESGINPAGIIARINNDMHIHTGYKVDELKATGRALGQGLARSAPPAPIITGSAYPGGRLVADTSAWKKGTTPLAYQWYKDFTPIPGATSQTYTTTWADAFPGEDWIGSATRISVKVTAPSSTYATKSAVSRTMFFSAPQVTIAGTPKVGGVLVAKVGSWSPAPYAYRYQWFRSLPGDTTGARTEIPGATGKKYTVSPDDVGAVLQVHTWVFAPDASNPQTIESWSSATAVVGGS